MQTRWRNLYPFCPPIRKFQVQCQPEPDSQSLVTSAPTRSEARRERYASAQRSHEEQRDYREGDNQTQDAGAAVLVLNHAHEAQDKPERGPQE